MWEWKTSDGIVRQFNACDNSKKCPICGQYFKKGEKGACIVPPMEIRNKYKKLSQNLIVHLEHWSAFCDGVETDVELAEKFQKYKTPKKMPFTDEEQKRISAFQSACRDFGFWEVYEKPYGIKCKKHGTSVYIEYNVYSDCIDLDYRGKRGMFDGFYSRQIIANVFNRMHETLGDGKHDDYSATKTIDNIYKEAEKMVQNII